jgi:hypothetical protein
VGVKLTSSDPTLALLSPNTSSAGQSQIVVSVPSGSSAVRFYVYGFASTGQAKVTADVAGYGSISANVRLEPSGFAWTLDHLSSVLYTQVPTFVPVGVFALDAASLIPVAAQTLRPGLVASINYTNSNPDVVAAVPPTLTFNVGNPVQIVGKAAGDAVLTLDQPPGFSNPAVYTQLKVSILTPSLQLSEATLAKDTQATLSFGNFTNGSLPVTVTSSDPSRLLVSADPNAMGSASVTVPQLSGHPIYLQALDNQGSVIITASMPSYNDGSAVVHLGSAGVGLYVDTTNSIPVSGVTGTYSTTTQSPQTRISLALFIVDPNSGRSLGAAGIPRPGIGPLHVEVRSSNVSAGTIVGSPAVFPVPSLGNGQQPSVNFQPVAAGTTDVSVIQPLGFVTPVDLTKVTFNVTQPGFSATDLTFGKDTFGQTFINLPNNVATPSTNLMATITSTDPTRVMLSPDQDTSPGPSVTRILAAGQRSFSFYIHALGNSGVVPLTITAPGYMDTTMKISLTDTFFYFEDNFNIDQTVHAVIQNGPQIIRIHATPGPTPNGTFQSQSTIRPGVNVSVTVNSSDSTIVRVDTDHVIFQGGTSSQDVVYQPLSPGLATLSLSLPPGYLSHPTQGQVIVNAQGAKLTLNLPSQIGRDLQSGGSVSAEDNFKQQTAVTITSSDPSRLLLSSSATAPGQATLSISATAGQPQIFVQSLADSGTITVTASANGYQNGTFNITLVPAAAVFQTASTQQTIYTNSAVQRLPVALAPLDPATLRPQTPQIPRLGANLSISVTSSDPKVLAVNTPTLQFPVDPQQQQQTALVQPAGVGTAILSLGPLPGGVMPASGSQIVFTVAEPDLFIPNFSLGRDLQVPLQVTLGSRLPTPTSDVTINVSQFGGVNLSNDPTLFSFNQTIPVVIPAGQRASRPFYAQGSFTGPTSLNISGAGYTTSQSTVTVTQTAFVFQEASQAQPIPISSGATTTFNVLPVLSPLGTPALAPMTIRAGAPPINVNVTSSNPAVLSVSTPQITLRPGDQRAAVTVRAVGSGRATLTLSGAIYDFSTAQSSLDVSVK